jgi:hypothetical protein
VRLRPGLPRHHGRIRISALVEMRRSPKVAPR